MNIEIDMPPDFEQRCELIREKMKIPTLSNLYRGFLLWGLAQVEKNSGPKDVKLKMTKKNKQTFFPFAEGL